jgi:hypothetical protein
MSDKIKGCNRKEGVYIPNDENGKQGEPIPIAWCECSKPKETTNERPAGRTHALSSADVELIDRIQPLLHRACSIARALALTPKDELMLYPVPGAVLENDPILQVAEAVADMVEEACVIIDEFYESGHDRAAERLAEAAA